jgi:hypothetical protein
MVNLNDYRIYSFFRLFCVSLHVCFLIGSKMYKMHISCFFGYQQSEIRPNGDSFDPAFPWWVKSSGGQRVVGEVDLSRSGSGSDRLRSGGRSEVGFSIGSGYQVCRRISENFREFFWVIFVISNFV